MDIEKFQNVLSVIIEWAEKIKEGALKIQKEVGTENETEEMFNAVIQASVIYWKEATFLVPINRRDSNKKSYQRRVVWYLLKNKTSLSFREIGKRVGNRRHSTCIVGIQTIASWMLLYPKVSKDIEELNKLANEIYLSNKINKVERIRNYLAVLDKILVENIQV